jgi:hypothetical protein
MELTPELFRNWVPARICFADSRPCVDWIYAGDRRFTDPFYDDTLRICQRLPFNQLFRRQTPMEQLSEIVRASDVISPTGFIFHISRCGSTLVSQMLASPDTNIVISEASVFDEIVRTQAADDQKVIWLRAMVDALGRRRFDREKDYFIKFDCWNTLDLDLIQRAFPETPWIFVYRNPVEVMVSNMREPGVQMIPGAIPGLFPGMSLDELLLFSKEERCARVIAKFFQAALDNEGSAKALLINYEQLPDAVFGSIAAHFGLRFDAVQTEAMTHATGFHAKSKLGGFSPDSEKKRAEASEAIIRYASEIVDPLYEKLEKIRLNGG